MSMIVVIEGSQTVRRMIEVALKGLPLELRFTQDPAQLPTTAPDLILSAARGPWGDAPALFAQLNVQGVTAPVVLMTPQRGEPARFVGGQVVAALRRPFKTQTLVRAICQVLELEVPLEGLFSMTSAIPLKRGAPNASGAQDEVAFRQGVLNKPLSTSAPSADEGMEVPSPVASSPVVPAPMPLSFQTQIGVPILDLPPHLDDASAFEEGMSFDDLPSLTDLAAGEPPMIEPPMIEPPVVESYEPSTSFGFSPSFEAFERGADADELPPPVEFAHYDSPPPIDEPSMVSSLDELDELEDLDDSFSALEDSRRERMSPEWRDELASLSSLSADDEPSSTHLTPSATPPSELPPVDESSVDESSVEPNRAEEPDVSRFATSSSPLLNSAVRQVVSLVAQSLKDEGIEQASSDEALALFAQVAWELIPELAERVVREEVERALSADSSRDPSSGALSSGHHQA